MYVHCTSNTCVRIVTHPSQRLPRNLFCTPQTTALKIPAFKNRVIAILSLLLSFSKYALAADVSIMSKSISMSISGTLPQDPSEEKEPLRWIWHGPISDSSAERCVSEDEELDTGNNLIF
mmetsp:Transcript_7847/g.9007  ORF Transcript_7847/g.9007 Transcript_7847/m.9007 type:complete len:120 (+) Transcript_7847:138-497(+)